MQIPGIRIRYINYAGYEIVLPNGKEIVLDTSVDYTNRSAFTEEDYRAADYIILSHTHYDHTQNLGYLAKKFGSKVFIGQMSLLAEMRHSDINLDQVYPVAPGDFFELEDFRLDVFRGKHTPLNDPNNTANRVTPPTPYFPESHLASDVWGSIEYMDYLITTKENLRIFITAGGAYETFFTNAIETAREQRPNIVFRQTTSKYTPEEFARTMAGMHPQLVLPLHQDGLAKKGVMTIQEYVDRANAEFERMGVGTRMFNPEQHRWYTIGMGIEAAE